MPKCLAIFGEAHFNPFDIGRRVSGIVMAEPGEKDVSNIFIVLQKTFLLSGIAGVKVCSAVNCYLENSSQTNYIQILCVGPKLDRLNLFDCI